MPVSVARVTPLRVLLLLVALVGIAWVALSSPAPASAAPQNGPIAQAALARLGTHGGQCWTFMKEVVRQATGRNIGYDYRLGFFEGGAYEVSAAEAQNGDIIQIANDGDTSPWAYYPGQHTAIILENLGGGKFNAIDSNQNWDEWVNLRPNYDPYAAAARYGLQVHIYRVPGGGPGGAAAQAPAPATQVNFDSGDSATVSADGTCLNLRTSASITAARIDCIPEGATVTITGDAVSADGYSWVPVSTASGDGWVAAQYLVKAAGASAAEAATEAPAESLGTAKTDDSPGCLRVRAEGNLSGAILDCLAAGTQVTLLSEGVPADGYTWVQVRIDGRIEGWVASEYLVP